MRTSPGIKNIADALAAFQASVEPVKKESVNPFFKSRFADLTSIIETIREPLAKNGLAFTQFPSGENGLSTMLMHTSGEWIEDTYRMTPVDAKPQSVGSALTYMRRYALCAILGLATEDDDGHAASQTSVPQKFAAGKQPDWLVEISKAQSKVELDNVALRIAGDKALTPQRKEMLRSAWSARKDALADALAMEILGAEPVDAPIELSE